MSQFKTVILVGSLRKDSMNLKLAKALAKLGKDIFTATYLNISDLPLFNQDLEADFPTQATRIKDEIKAADAVLIVTPEYNRSFPAPLKNAIDWCSRPYGQNAFAGKPAALCGTSPGAIGTATAQAALKPVLSYLDLALMGQPELYLQFKDGMIDADGNIANPDTEKFLLKYVDSFAAWVSAHQSTAKAKAA
ncbi:MAG: NADPH-dependent FMN reductase [Rickettsiales bacterium]